MRLQPGSVFAGHRIEEIAGRGGMGVVYRATELELGRSVALKLIAPQLADDSDFRQRFQRESRLAASIDHPNVIPVYRAGESDGGLFITMRYVEGTDLADLIVREGMVPPKRAVAIITQVAAALDAAHQRGLVHRDVKPANILVAGHGQGEHIYLTDFGLTLDTTAIGGLTQTGQFVGTIDYSSPEQIEGKPAGAGADVYSLGCVLFHAVTGRRPYERDSDVAKLFAHLNDPPPAITELLPTAPSIFNDVIRRSLAKEPADRYPSAGDLARAAHAALHERAAGTPERSVAVGPAAADMPVRGGPPVLTAVAKPPTQHASPGGAPSNGGVQSPQVGTSGGGAWTPPTSPYGRASDPSAAGRRGPGLWVALGSGAALLVALVIGIMLVAGGGDDSDKKEQAIGPAPSAPPAAPPAGLAGAKWRELTPMRLQRQQVPAVAVDGAVWVIGGLTTAAATKTVEGYDPVLNSWKAAPDLPVALHHATGVAYKGDLVVIGGWIPDGPNLSATVSKRVFTLRDGTSWTELPPLKNGRTAAAAAVADGKIVVVGGQSEGRLVKSTEVFDGKSWTEGAPMPTAREHLAAAADGRYLYAAGGRILSSDRNVKALERYDPATDSWKKLVPMPTARGGLGAAIVNGQLVTVGSEEATRVLGTVESYNVRSGRWSKLPDLAVPRHGVGVASLGDTVYVLGGARKPTHLTSAKTAEALDMTPSAG